MAEATRGGADPTMSFTDMAATPHDGQALTTLQQLRAQQRSGLTPDQRIETMERNIGGLAKGYTELQSDIIRGFTRFEHQVQTIAKMIQQITGKPIDGMDGRSALDRGPLPRDPESVLDAAGY